MDITPEPERCTHCELLLAVCMCDPGPYVCPGCFAVGGEPCAPGCIDDAIWRAQQFQEDSASGEDDLYGGGTAWSTGWEDES